MQQENGNNLIFKVSNFFSEKIHKYCVLQNKHWYMEQDIIGHIFDEAIKSS